MYGRLFEELVGEIITDVSVSVDKKQLYIKTTDNEYKYRTVNGCDCDDTWIENVELPALGLPALVLGYKYLQLGKGPPFTGRRTVVDDLDSEVIQYYGYGIVTAKGLVEIDFRNNSNGYYGGALERA